MVTKTYWAVNSLTGRRELQLFPSAGGWRSKINGVDNGSTYDILVRDRITPVTTAAWAAALEPWAMRLVAEWDGKVKYAGWILGHDWDSRSGRVRIKHADFRAIAARRALFGVGPMDLPDIVIENRSLRGLMGEYAWKALVDGAYRWALRVTIDPADRLETGPYTERIPRYRVDSAENLWRDIQDRENGPEMHFYPRWSATDGALEDVLRIGTPTLTSNSIDLIHAPKTPLIGFGYTLDGEKQRTGVFGMAQGRGDDGKIGVAGIFDEGVGDGPIIPFLDAKHDISDTTDQDVANSKSREILKSLRKPIKQYRFQIADEDLSAQAENGTRVNVYYQGDEMQPSGWINGRVIASSHGVGDRFLGLEIQ